MSKKAFIWTFILGITSWAVIISLGVIVHHLITK